MELRVKTQAAFLRATRANSEKEGRPSTFEAVKTDLKTQLSTKRPSSEEMASVLALSANLRAEMRALGEARREALGQFNKLETAESTFDNNTSSLQRLKELAHGFADQRKEKDDSTDQDLQYDILLDQIERVAKSAVNDDIVSAAERDPVREILVERDYANIPAQSPFTIKRATRAALDATIGNIDEYKNYLKALRRRIEDRLDRLSYDTKALAKSESPLPDNAFATAAAGFAQNRILGQAEMSLKFQANSLPDVALTLLTV